MTVRKLTPQQLLEQFHVLEKMAQSERVFESFCLDEYLQEEVVDAIQELNVLYPMYCFEHKEVFSGFGHDLVVTDVERKQTYNLIPKPHTYGELFDRLEKEHGIKTTAKFHHKPTERLTTKEFQQILAFYQSICVDSLFETGDNGDDEHD